MICIVGGRGSGKTTELIKMSAETGIPICVRNRSRIKNIVYMANRLGVEIPEPIVIYNQRFLKERRTIMIDDVQDVLFDIYGTEVVCATFDKDSVDLSGVTLFELLGMWWKMRKGEHVDFKRVD